MSVGYDNDKMSIFSHLFGLTIKYRVEIKDTALTPLETCVETIKSDVIIYLYFIPQTHLSNKIFL